ncbi:MAG: TetR family transcriptional regulator [Actinobacteria bacterium ATB1]|nr:TetR family transcriptional regulator [Actinobacteria bacterium ATB1]
MTFTSLRERTKERTRHELADAAMRLFADRGFEHVTVDDIAAEAGTSRRTFFRYFEAKEDVFFVDHADLLDKLRLTLSSRPPDEPVLTAVRESLIGLSMDVEADHDGFRARLITARATPSVTARHLELQTAWEEAIADVVAERLGLERCKTMIPGVVAATSVAAVRAAIDAWLDLGAEASLAELAAEALDLLDGGLHGINRKSTTKQPTSRGVGGKREKR